MKDTQAQSTAETIGISEAKPVLSSPIPPVFQAFCFGLTQLSLLVQLTPWLHEELC